MITPKAISHPAAGQLPTDLATLDSIAKSAASEMSPGSEKMAAYIADVQASLCELWPSQSELPASLANAQALCPARPSQQNAHTSDHTARQFLRERLARLGYRPAAAASQLSEAPAGVHAIHPKSCFDSIVSPETDNGKGAQL